MTDHDQPTDWGSTLAFLTLRLWLGSRALLTGIEKFADTRTLTIPLLDADGNPDASGAMVEVQEKFYALSNYHAVPSSLADSLAREPLLPGFLVSPFYAILGWVLILVGLTLIIGVFNRISLATMGGIYIALTAGLILIKQDGGVSWLAIHIGLIAAALVLSKYNRFSVTRS